MKLQISGMIVLKLLGLCMFGFAYFLQVLYSQKVIFFFFRNCFYGMQTCFIHENKSSGISSMASIAGIASMVTSSSWETGGADPTSESLLRMIWLDRWSQFVHNLIKIWSQFGGYNDDNDDGHSGARVRSIIWSLMYWVTGCMHCVSCTDDVVAAIKTDCIIGLSENRKWRMHAAGLLWRTISYVS